MNTHALPTLPAGLPAGRSARRTSSPRRFVRILATAGLLAALLPGPALANGIGDLYVAAPDGVSELYVKGEELVTTVEITPGPVAIAFTPDGQTLWATDGGRFLTRVDIESISVAGTVDLPEAAGPLAHPKGDALAISFPESGSIAWLEAGETDVADGPHLPGAADLLAADRRDDRVLAAEAGASWIAIAESGDDAARSMTVEGEIVDLAVARNEGAGYVLTTGPDRVSRFGLDTLEIEWTAALPEAGVAVAAWPDGALVAHGSAVSLVTAAGDEPFAEAAAPLLDLAVSDEGRVAYAASASAIEAFAGDGAPAAATLELENGEPAAIAPVPRESSLGAGAGPIAGSGDGTGDGTGSGDGSQPGASIPPTDTLPMLGDALVEGREWLPGAALVGLLIVAVSRIAIARSLRRRA